MRRKLFCPLLVLLAFALMLSACSAPQQAPVAQAAPPEPADWMSLDMGWVPGQNYDGIQIMEIRRHDENRLEIAHVPVTGLQALDDELAAQARRRMDEFEAASAQSEPPMRFMLECAVTQSASGIISVIFSQQDSLRQGQGQAPLISLSSYDKATGQPASPLSGYQLTGEIQDALSSQLRAQAAAGAAVSEDEPWLINALQSEGTAWDNAIAQADGAALVITAPSGQAVTAQVSAQQVDAARQSLATTPATTAPEGGKPAGDGKKLVALTFDDGPAKNTTADLLDILKQYDVKATFFVQGVNVDARPELVARAHQEGHEIGNHTYDHKNLTKISMDEVNEQINKTADAVERACGVRPTLLRPPYGATTYKLRDQLTVPVIKWSVEPADSFTKDTAQIVKTVLNDTHDGDIVLLHDTHNYTVAAVPQIIEGLREKGFTFVTVTELLTRNGDTLKGGEAYRYCRPQ